MRFSAARLRAWSLSRAALAPSTRISSSTIEASRTAMSSRRLVSPSRRSVRKSGSSDGEGAELVEQCLLGLQLLAERKRGSRFMNTSRRHEPGVARGHSEIAVARVVAGCWKFKVGRRKFTDACAVRPVYGGLTLHRPRTCSQARSIRHDAGSRYRPRTPPAGRREN